MATGKWGACWLDQDLDRKSHLLTRWPTAAVLWEKWFGKLSSGLCAGMGRISVAVIAAVQSYPAPSSRIRKRHLRFKYVIFCAPMERAKL